METMSLFSLIFSVVLLIALGYVSRVTKLLKRDDSAVLNNIIVYLALPALIFLAIRNSEISLNFLLIPLVGWVVMLGCAAIAFLLSRIFNLKRPTIGAFLLAAAIGNTGYIGYPLSLAFGGQSFLVRAIFFDIFGTVLFAFTVGLYFAEVYGANGQKIHKIKEILTFPPLIALFFGLVLHDLDLPLFFLKSLEYLSAAAVPLIMISVGLSLQFKKLGEYKLLLFLLCGIKLILSPALAYCVGKMVSLPPISLNVVVLEASMPIALLAFIIGLKYELDVDFLPVAIAIATLMSMVTVPIWQCVIALL
ncbi:MAG TPA: AEC family transporter [Actinobacteria bacterium]|nr:AEC family transporter [Actinomycetota bacterium]